MSKVGQIECEKQNRVVELFKTTLEYEYYCNWGKRSGKVNVRCR